MAQETFADRQIVSATIARLKSLKPEQHPQWGRMTANQMLCHLNDSFLTSLGERHASDASNFFNRTLLKWIALRSPLQWPKGVKTRPENEQGIGGTLPTAFEADHANLLNTIHRFTDPGAALARRHPIFGAMSTEEWLRWGYLHCDHHLRQFGL